MRLAGQDHIGIAVTIRVNRRGWIVGKGVAVGVGLPVGVGVRVCVARKMGTLLVATEGDRRASWSLEDVVLTAVNLGADGVPVDSGSQPIPPMTSAARGREL